MKCMELMILKHSIQIGMQPKHANDSEVQVSFNCFCLYGPFNEAVISSDQKMWLLNKETKFKMYVTNEIIVSTY